MMKSNAVGSTNRLRRLGYLLLALVLVALALYPPLAGGYTPQRATNYLIYGLLAFSVALMVGYGRLFNIGIGTVFGLSGYTIAILTQHGVANPFVLFVAAIAAGLLISVLFGIYAVVASGVEYLMLTFLTTLAMFKVPSLATELTGGDNGLIVKGGLEVSFGFSPLFGTEFYYFVLAVVVACVLLCWYVLESQTGKAVRAIGRNPLRAAAMGYQVSQYRVALTLLSGFVAAVAGWLYALQSAFVSEELLGPNASINSLVYALVGGVDYILGPFVGAAGFRYLTENLSRRSTQSSLFIGAALLFVVYFMPNGILGLLHSLVRRVRGRRGARVSEPEQLEIEEPIATLGADEPRSL
jgi:branched-chain amino acid transport system permease protein